MDFISSKNLLDEWGITDSFIRDTVLNSENSPDLRKELCGWVDKYYNDDQLNIDENRFKEALRMVQENEESIWETDLYLAQKQKREVEIQTLVSPPQVEEGIHTCKKCSSKRTVSIGVQLRSADEPMTQFISCTNCGNRWKK